MRARRTARGVDADRRVERVAASAVDGVDLVTSLDLAEGLPVADGPVLVIPGVNNNGATDATNVVVDVALPAGASVADLPPECATSPGGAACSFELISAGSGFGVALFLTFAAPGTYSITSTARADQSDVDGDSSPRLDVVVVEENVDLSGEVAVPTASSSERKPHTASSTISPTTARPQRPALRFPAR